jgi:hypothetical protein
VPWCDPADLPGEGRSARLEASDKRKKHAARNASYINAENETIQWISLNFNTFLWKSVPKRE